MARRKDSITATGDSGYLMGLLDDGPLVLATFDAEARCTFVNAAAERLVGRANGECKGKALSELLSHDTQALSTCERILQDVMAGGRISRYELALPSEYGGGKYCIVLYPTSTSEGTAAELLCVGLDVSHAPLLENHGEPRPYGRDRMLAILAHELRNPLATIRSGLKILEISSSKEQTAKARMMMERQLAYVIRLVNEVLDLSRLHEGRLSLHKEPIVLGDVINLALETSSASLKNGKHSVSVAIPDVAVALRGDSTRLAQALSNLLDNASKYTPEGGAVSLAAMLDGTEVVIQVSDTGLGIPADRLDHIFTLFSQIDGHRGYSRGGLGIGLFLVKAIVEGHGGSVRAESLGEGKGAVFTMRLPLGEDV